jgi:hypothetical protein
VSVSLTRHYVQQMTHPRDYLPALDQIEAALEASCGALVTLESLSSGAADPAGANPAQDNLGHAIGSLRDVIDALRLAQCDASDALALGFVLEGSPARNAGGPDPSQTNPRRTA